MQRKLEVKARQQNDVTEALRSVGDKEGARQSDAAARDIVSVYDRVSGKAGLSADYARTRAGKTESTLLTTQENGNIINMAVKRQMPNGLRAPIAKLTEEQISDVLRAIEEISADKTVFDFEKWRFGTFYDDKYDIVHVSGNVFPDQHSNKARDIMSVRAVLAHEYYGIVHLKTQGPK